MASVTVDLDSPVLFGRGIWHVNGEEVHIEIPGWYAYIDAAWRPVEVEVEVW